MGGQADLSYLPIRQKMSLYRLNTLCSLVARRPALLLRLPYSSQAADAEAIWTDKYWDRNFTIDFNQDPVQLKKDIDAKLADPTVRPGDKHLIKQYLRILEKARYMATHDNAKLIREDPACMEAIKKQAPLYQAFFGTDAIMENPSTASYPGGVVPDEPCYKKTMEMQEKYAKEPAKDTYYRDGAKDYNLMTFIYIWSTFVFIMLCYQWYNFTTHKEIRLFKWIENGERAVYTTLSTGPKKVAANVKSLIAGE